MDGSGGEGGRDWGGECASEDGNDGIGGESVAVGQQGRVPVVDGIGEDVGCDGDSVGGSKQHIRGVQLQRGGGGGGVGDREWWRGEHVGEGGGHKNASSDRGGDRRRACDGLRASGGEQQRGKRVDIDNGAGMRCGWRNTGERQGGSDGRGAVGEWERGGIV